MKQASENLFSRHIFCMTSDNRQSFQPWLYGWRIKDNVLHGSGPLDEGDDWRLAPLDDGGAHVIMTRRGDKLDLRCDPAGNGMLFVYRDGPFWAISNSFMALHDVLRHEYKARLHLNEDYACQILLQYSSPFTISQTMCEEISLLPWGDLATVDKRSGELNVTRVPRKSGQKSLLSPEGVAIVDFWIAKWVSKIRAISASGAPFQIDVTGGFDSRNMLALVLASGVDLDRFEFYIEMIDPGDEAVADQLASIGGFKLSEPQVFKIEPEIDLRCWNLALGGIAHDQVIFPYSYRGFGFNLTGGSGETRRSEWQRTVSWFCEHNFTLRSLNELSSKAACAFMKEYFQIKNMIEPDIDDDLAREKEGIATLYKYSQRRMHFGRRATRAWLANKIYLQPMADPLLERIHQYDCPDADTLYAFLMERVGGELKNAPYERGRSFGKESVAVAKRLNSTYPLDASILAEGGRVEPISVKANPVEYEEYTGDATINDLMRREVMAALPKIRGKFSMGIEDYARNRATDFLHGNLPHLPIIAGLME